MSGGQKASDYVLEPCVAMPEIKPAPDQRDWGQPVDGIGVLSEKGMWEARAKAARDAADALRLALRHASPILKSNYLGEGCSEGLSLRTQLLEALGEAGWSGEVNRQIRQLEELALTCERAATRIAAADADSSEELSAE